MSNLKRVITPYRYSSAVAAGDYVFLGLHRSFGITFPAQLKRTLDEIKETLARLGLGLDSLVKVNVWLKNIRDLPVMEKVFADYFKRDEFPERCNSSMRIA